MHPDYAMMREDDRTLALIGAYCEQFQQYMKTINRKWAGDPLRTFDPKKPKSFDFWGDCEGIRKACDATDTSYDDFWGAAFHIVFEWDHPYPTPALFYRKKGGGPNVAFLTQIIKSIEKPTVITSNSPYYHPDNYVSAPQQKEYFQGVKKKLFEIEREDIWRRMVKGGKIPLCFA